MTSTAVGIKTGIRHLLKTNWHTWMALIFLVCMPACQPEKTDPLQAGETAPGFTLHSARGDKRSLQDARDHPVLVAFLDTQAEVGETADPSRAQVVFLKSMQEQYGSNGLTVFIVDASRLQTGVKTDDTALLNYTYDWQLNEIPVLADPNSRVARLYGVSSLPATFLVGADGILLERWDGLASAAQLAFALQAALGIPIF